MKHVPDWLIRRLREVPRLNVRSAGPSRLEMWRSPEVRVTFEVQSYARLGSRNVGRILNRPRTGQELVATRSLSGPVREKLSHAGISWVERDTGIVHLDSHGLFVHLEPATPPAEMRDAAPSLSFGGATGILVEALLECCRERPFTLRELTAQLDVTKGRVSQILSRLVDAGFIDAEGRTRSRVYELRDPGRLLDRWAESGTAAPEHTTGVYVWSRTPADLYRRLTALEEAGIGWAVGGTAAAHAYTPSLSTLPSPNLWIQASVPTEEAARALDGEVVRPEEAPNLALWQTEGDPALVFARALAAPGIPEVPLRLVSRPRAYVEARISGGRGVDAAEALREEVRL